MLITITSIQHNIITSTNIYLDSIKTFNNILQPPGLFWSTPWMPNLSTEAPWGPSPNSHSAPLPKALGTTPTDAKSWAPDPWLWEIKISRDSHLEEMDELYSNTLLYNYIIII
jgi:hypothetical protein